MFSLGERLVELRKEKGMLQKAIAQKVGVSVRIYQKYEKGEGEPTVSKAARIADLFDVSIDYLMGRTEKREVNK